MAKKTWKKLPSLFKTKELAPPPRKHPWQFLPSCGHQRRTLSFRADDETFITVNSIFSDPFDSTIESSKFESFSIDSVDDDHNHYDDVDSLEMFVSHGVMSERLFFEPGNKSSFLEKTNYKVGGFSLKESIVLLAMESKDPYGDFKGSMEEMVETLGVKDWKGLEELLGWYLKVNDKNNHGFIMLAFVDLLISLTAASGSCSYSNSSYCSALSSFASSPIASIRRLE